MQPRRADPDLSSYARELIPDLQSHIRYCRVFWDKRGIYSRKTFFL